MKILMVLDRPNLYGSELHFLDLADYFNKVENVKVLVLNDGPLLKILSTRSINYTIIKTGWLPGLGFIRQAKELIKNYSPDVIHSHQPKANFLIALLNVFIGKKHIVTIHSQALDHSLVHNNALKRKLTFLFHRLVQFISEWRATSVVYVSNAASKTSFFRKKLRVIYNWVSKDKTTGIDLARSVDKGVIKIISIGSVTYAKGFDLLIELARCLRSKNIAAEFHIVGSDELPFATDLKKQVKQEMFDNIFFHGYQQNTSSFLHQAHFFALFSRSETFGLSYIEAMQNGLPVMALDFDTMREVIPPGNSLSANMESHADYIERLQSDKSIYNATSVSNKKHVVENFDYNSAMGNYHQFYKEVAG